MANKFKRGDRVRVRADVRVVEELVGRVGTVLKCTDDHTYFKMINVPPGLHYWLCSSQLELDVPLSPFEQSVRDYIKRELPSNA